MSKRIVKKYNSEFKTKVVLEVIKEDATINQIASKYQVPPTNVIDWKKKFFENVSIVFNKEKAVKQYQEKLKSKDREIEALYKELGKVTAEYSWLKKTSESMI